jgi:hypothetical protein
MLNTLHQVLKVVGKSTEIFTMPDGSRLLLLPYGARVLGLFPAEGDDNFYWTNPVLEDAESARALFASPGWHNTGGDRTWISPEVDTFFLDATPAQYWQPRPLDMSVYSVERTGGGCQLSREMNLHLARPNSDVNLRLTKWFGPASNPLRWERDVASVLGSVQYAGYTQRVELQSLDGPLDRQATVGLWNLAQLPRGGELLVPLYSPATPQKCFGDVPADRVTLEDHLLRVKADFSGSHKIAMKAVSLCGRTGYVYGRGDQWSLVVRNFFVKPSGEYIDSQRHDPDDYGYAFQMCRVDEVEFGSFLEMEYHAPALGDLPDPTRSEDVSQIWAFRGTFEAIGAIAMKLLGAKLNC